MGSCFAFEFSDGSWRIFEDKTSGARTERNGLNRALEQLRDGDTLVVWRLDRLGRSLKDLIARAEALVEETISAGLDDLDARLAGSDTAPRHWPISPTLACPKSAASSRESWMPREPMNSPPSCARRDCRNDTRTGKIPVLPHLPEIWKNSAVWGHGSPHRYVRR